MSDVIVFKNRTNILSVNIGIDVSSETITSQIREGKTSTSPLIATWDVSYLTDGTDGKLVFTLDDSATSLITQKFGYMDVKRVSNGEPLPVFLNPVKVVFRDVVTA